MANQPSPSTVLFFLKGSAIFNYAAGFDPGFSFFYSSNGAATVHVHDGLDATGNRCNWTAIDSNFTGTARSIDFGGTVDQVACDNVIFGSDVPGTNDVPEPSSLTLLGL